MCPVRRIQEVPLATAVNIIPRCHPSSRREVPAGNCNLSPTVFPSCQESAGKGRHLQKALARPAHWLDDD